MAFSPDAESDPRTPAADSGGRSVRHAHLCFDKRMLTRGGRESLGGSNWLSANSFSIKLDAKNFVLLPSQEKKVFVFRVSKDSCRTCADEGPIMTPGDCIQLRHSYSLIELRSVEVSTWQIKREFLAEGAFTRDCEC